MLVDALSAALRALSFVALFQAAGTAIFIAVFGRALDASTAGVRRVGIASALAAIALVLSHYLLEAGRMSGELTGMMDPTLQGMVMHSSASVAATWRVAGLLLIVVGLRVASSSGLLLAVVGATLAIAAFTLLGHTATNPARWAMSMLLLLHLLVVAFWFGSLVPLILVSSRERAAAASAVVEQFSGLAIWLVPGLFVAGLLLAILLLPDVAALLTPYGSLLVAKILGFAVLMGLAALNKWRLGPALVRDDRNAKAAFQRAVVAEYVLIVAVLCVTAVLTSFFSPEG